MPNSDLITLSGSAMEPASFVRATMLLAAMMLSAIFSMVLLTVPLPNHKIIIDLYEAQSQRLKERYHKIEVGVDGRVSIDSLPCADLNEFLTALNFIAIKPQSIVELSIDPNSRYEDFLITLAIIKRAGVDELRVDFASTPHRLVVPAELHFWPGRSESSTRLASSLTMPVGSGCARSLSVEHLSRHVPGTTERNQAN